MSETYVAATLRDVPGGRYWLAISPALTRRSSAVIAATVFQADAGLRDMEFVVAVFDGPDLVSVLDEDGDPLDWGLEDRADLFEALVDVATGGMDR